MAEKKELTLREQVKAALPPSPAIMREILESLKPQREKWNLLVRRIPGGGIATTDHDSYEQGRLAQENAIKKYNPVMTALVRDKRRR